MKGKIMKGKRFIALAAVAVFLIGTLAACATSGDGGTPSSAPPSEEPQASTPAPAVTTPEPEEVVTEPSFLEQNGLDENLRFTETQKIRVEVYERAGDGMTPAHDNFFTDYIKKGILDKHNIEVEYVPVGRWTEGDDINNLLAAGTAPDVCVSYSYPTVNTYGHMGGMFDIYPLMNDHRDLFPNIFNLLGTTNVFWDKDPVDNHLWALEAILYGTQNAVTGTFMRSDWLDKLNLKAPTTLQEFEDALVAFRDNADTLLGSDAKKMIPFLTSYDIRWGTRPLVDSFIPDNVTHKERYISSPIEFFVANPASKEAVRVFNKWYNMNLMWNDFSLYDASNLGSIADDLIRAGYVGALVGNYDQPYRDGENSFQLNVQRNVGPEAGFIPVNPFPNDSGKVVRMGNNPVDRKVFFPSVGDNNNLLAALLYVDFISSPDVVFFLQYGEEGVHYEKLDNGAIKTINVEGEKKINSQRNIDYTITLNGSYITDPELNLLTVAAGYPGTDPEVIKTAIEYTTKFSKYMPKVDVGDIAAEEGIVPELNSKRDTLYIQAVTAKPDNFDSVWESGYNDMLNSGLQAIIDERTAKWEATYGDKVFLEFSE